MFGWEMVWIEILETLVPVIGLREGQQGFRRVMGSQEATIGDEIATAGSGNGEAAEVWTNRNRGLPDCAPYDRQSWIAETWDLKPNTPRLN
jgi:hypothetical protein